MIMLEELVGGIPTGEERLLSTPGSQEEHPPSHERPVDRHEIPEGSLRGWYW